MVWRVNALQILFIKLYKYEFRTITGTWKQGSSYFVVKPIKYGFSSAV
jgi:hypothetical protein